MIVVTGHLVVDPADRDAYVAAYGESVRAARATKGCTDFAVSPDPLDPARVNVAERWQDRASLDAFRGSGPDSGLAERIRAADVAEFDVAPADPSDGQGPATSHDGQPAPDSPADPRPDRIPEGIGDVIEERARAVAARDDATLTSRFAADLDSFVVTPPFRTSGADALAQGTREWLDGYELDLRYRVHDLEVTEGDDLAVAAFVYEVTGTLTSGEAVEMWVRSTAVYRREADRWMLVHQHESVPWDPSTGQGVLTPPPPGRS